MRKTPVICSLLMAFGLSAMMVGCEPAAKATKAAPKPAGPGSTTGGGAEVPKKPSTGSAEKPKAASKPADAPAKAEEAPKTDETPKADDTPKD